MFETPPRPRRLRNNGLFDNERSQPSYEQQGKISEMINPDGSVTVRRKILNPDGTSSICQEEYSNLDHHILGNADTVNYEAPSGDEMPSLERSSSGSSSSASTIKTSPSRAAYLSSNRYRFPSEKEGMAGRTTERPTKTVPVDLQRNESIPIDERDMRLQLDGANPAKRALRMELTRPVTPIQSHNYYSQPSRLDARSNVASTPFDDDHNQSELKELRRPANPVPFEKELNSSPPPDPSYISVSTWGIPGADVSAISGDSVVYPMLEISSAFHENNEKSDDETEWSLLLDEEDGKPLTVPVRRENLRDVGGKPPLPNRSRDTGNRSDPAMQSNLVVMKQAPVLAKPKPKVKYFADPGIASTTTAIGEEHRDDLRDKGALFDAPSMLAHDESSETISVPPDKEIVFTVQKYSPDDKIGIFVGVRELADGPRLVVSKVSPTGKFAESPIAIGDTVVSINGKNFLNFPSSEEALDIVRSATDKVTFVVLKNRGQDANTSTDEFSLPSLPYYNVNDMVNPDGSKTVTREVKNNDGSQTVILEHFDPSGRKLRQLSRRRWVTFEGSTRDASIVSLTFNGELSILINKTSQSQIVGLGLIVNLTHRGRKALVVSQVSPSGIFARTPLSVGDTIISINGVDFSEKPNINGAAALLSKTEGNVTVRALKSKNWIERRKRRLPQSRHLEESFTIPAPKSRSFEFDNVSYGGSSLGYQSAKKLTLKDFSASELHGIALKCEPTQWGALLVATIVAPSSRFTAAGLQDGDIILSVNGVDFREEPDANKAMSLIHSADADADTEIEYQRLDNSVQEERETPIIKAKHSFKPDGTKCIRTETRNPDGSILVNLKEIGPGNAVDVAIKESPASLVRASDMSEISGWDGLTLHNYMHDEQSLALEDASVPTSAESLSIVTNPLEPVTITVDKKSKSQNVGISLVASEGVLYVKKISAGGLLVGKPILPGDTVIAINGRDFRSNPSVKEASSTILNSFKTLSLKILKTSLTGGGRGKELVTPKIRGVSRFCCSKPMDHSDKSATRKIVLGSSKRSEYKSLIL